MVSHDSLTDKAGHVAWCALVAMKIAIQEGLATSEAQKNVFLTRWLATALKQRRFHRDVTPDIEWLLKQGRAYGVRARLANKLEYLWQACTRDLSEQSDLFRLKYALETAQEMSWQYHLLNDRDWQGSGALKFNPELNSILLSATSLQNAFDDGGIQIQPLLVRINGAACGFQTLLDRCDWASTHSEEKGIFELNTKKKNEVAA